MKTLEGKEISLVIGHCGDGATGEESYNTDIAYKMAGLLESRGADVLIHHHHIVSYGARQRAMREAIKEQQPDCACCIELHYNAYHKESVSGHEFFYRGSKKLAKCFQKRFSKAFPFSTARCGGVKPLMSGDGSGFLREAPAWACLLEPFFFTNKAEKQFFEDHQDELSECNVDAIEDFLT
jgi:N-acetylmuramoyl-L-alanine amidase